MFYPDEYLLGIRLFERGDYFESHEVWESLWNQTAGVDRDFYQGLIQVAVALCHYCNGNMRGGGELYRRATGRLERYRPRHRGLDVDRFLADLGRCFAPVLAADAEHPVPFDASLVPCLALDPPPDHWPPVPMDPD